MFSHGELAVGDDLPSQFLHHLACDAVWASVSPANHERVFEGISPPLAEHFKK